MGLWGATAGDATLVGPLLGGVLVDGLGWEWIFFINVPGGVLGFVLAAIFVPRLETHPHRFDMVGVVLSATALFLIVFGLQEGEKYDWGTIAGSITVWDLIIAGLGSSVPSGIVPVRCRPRVPPGIVPLGSQRFPSAAWCQLRPARQGGASG